MRIAVVLQVLDQVAVGVEAVVPDGGDLPWLGRIGVGVGAVSGLAGNLLIDVVGGFGRRADLRRRIGPVLSGLVVVVLLLWSG